MKLEYVITIAISMEGVIRKLTKVIQIRVSEFELNRLKFLAAQFSGGNVSRWIKFCALNADRENIEYESETDGRKKKAPVKGPVRQDEDNLVGE